MLKPMPLFESQRISAPLWCSALTGALDRVRDTSGNEVSIYLHPCVIDGRPHLVFERGLERRNPDAYALVNRLAWLNGWSLLEDRRQKDQAPARERRRPWAVILLLALGITFETAAAEVSKTAQLGGISTASAQSAVPAQVNFSAQVGLLHEQTDVGLISARSGSEPPRIRASEPGRDPVEGTRPLGRLGKEGNVHAVEALELRRILHDHYQASPESPAYLASDLGEMAAYYAGFPEVVSLVRRLESYSWRLVYQKETWTARARGTAADVHSVEISFDPRAAAQLRLNPRCGSSPACIASPADALLHELLHADAMLSDTRRFIEQGGMSGFVYPYAHEDDVLSEERRLYQQMTKRDGVPRPHRTYHTGRLIEASCAVCIQ